MADTEPLMFKIVLGTLRPMSGAAEDALRSIGAGETVRIDIKRVRGNQKRLTITEHSTEAEAHATLGDER